MSRYGGVIEDGEITYRHGLGEEEIEEAAFHEGWHKLANVGSVRWWVKQPQGRTTVAKWEARAGEFARLFPAAEGESSGD